MIQLVIIFGYLGLLLFLGLFSSRLFRGTSQDYMLASHSIGPVLLLMSLFGTTMTAFALVGSTGEAYKEGVGVYGMLASSSGIIHSLCFFLLGVKLWSWGKQYGYTKEERCHPSFAKKFPDSARKHWTHEPTCTNITYIDDLRRSRFHPNRSPFSETLACRARLVPSRFRPTKSASITA